MVHERNVKASGEQGEEKLVIDYVITNKTGLSSLSLLKSFLLALL